MSEEELREVTRYVAICARPVLPIFEVSYPQDSRPRDAILGAEAFANGSRRTAALRTLALAAFAAAREVEAGPAAQAAYAATYAASAAYLHPIAVATQIKHILGAAVHQAIATELLAPEDTEAANRQLQWAANLASPTVREVLKRYPQMPRGHTRFSTLLYELDTELRNRQS